METNTIIYLVAAALILRVLIKLVARYLRESKNSQEEES